MVNSLRVSLPSNKSPKQNWIDVARTLDMKICEAEDKWKQVDYLQAQLEHARKEVERWKNLTEFHKGRSDSLMEVVKLLSESNYDYR